MPTRIDNLTPFAAELLDFGGVAPAAGKGLVWDGEGKLVAADVVVQSDLADYATTSAVTEALADKADASELSAHTAATDNPHAVTAEQVGAYTKTQVDGLISAITYSDVGAAAATGTSNAYFQIGSSGPRLQRGLTLLEVRNAAGTAYHPLVAASMVVGTTAGPLFRSAITHALVSVGGGTTPGLRAQASESDTTLRAFEAGIVRFAEIYAGADDAFAYKAGDLVVANSIATQAFIEHGQPLRERYTRHWLDLESKSDLATLPATIGDQATVLTGDANDPIHRYELMGDDLDDGTYDTPAENLANWRRIVALDADGEIKGPILNRLVLDTDDVDVAKIGEIVCVVDDLDEPTTVSYRMGDGTTKTESLPEIATVTP